jgi:hypothetical protein
MGERLSTMVGRFLLALLEDELPDPENFLFPVFHSSTGFCETGPGSGSGYRQLIEDAQRSLKKRKDFLIIKAEPEGYQGHG